MIVKLILLVSDLKMSGIFKEYGKHLVHVPGATATITSTPKYVLLCDICCALT